MRNPDLQFTHDVLFMKSLLSENSMDKTANDFTSAVMSDIKDKVSHLTSPEEVLAFIVPGAFWALGFRKLTIIYGIAEAFGFDFKSFFASLRQRLAPIVKDLFAGKKASHSDISEVVESSVSDSFTENVNPDKLQDVMEKSNSNKNYVNDANFLVALGAKYNDDPLLAAKIRQFAESMGGRRARQGITGVIVKIFTFILSAMLYSLGFALIGSAASRALGLNKDKSDSTSTSQNVADVAENVSNNNVESTDKPNTANQTPLHLNPSADSNLYTTTYNDINHVWIMHVNINDIRSKLIEWAQELYPQLNQSTAFDKSDSFDRTLKAFKDRNKNSEQLGIIAVPPPYTSIKQIVDSFAADVANKMQSN